MINELTAAGYPKVLVDITRDIYSSSTFQVKTAGGLTKPLQRGTGIVQGCPWSVVVFEQGVDKRLRWVHTPITLSQFPIWHRATLTM